MARAAKKKKITRYRPTFRPLEGPKFRLTEGEALRIQELYEKYKLKNPSATVSDWLRARLLEEPPKVSRVATRKATPVATRKQGVGDKNQ